MSFRLHLLIVSLIIGIVYLAWQSMYGGMPAPVVVQQAPVDHSNDGKAIKIIRASWGRNCANVQYGNSREEPLAKYADAQQDSPVRENNVLETVSKLCDNQLTCTIPINSETLGPDPLPQCYDKQLEIEYRCFAFDRPWRLRGTTTPLTIDCSKKGG